MAPSASMLFLSYHQLHHGPAAAEAEAEAGVAPREGGAGGFRFSFRNVFSPVVLAPPRRNAAAPEVAGAAQGKQRGCHAGGDQTEKKAASALDSKFEEAVRLSCWSS